MPNVVLVTGVSRFLGGHLAARLAANPQIERILGVDTTPPTRDMKRRLGRTEFVRADIRNPLINKIISGARVDTVVHAAVNTNSGPGGRAVHKEMNVIGTMQLLAACQRSPDIRKMVVRSTSSVYGSSAKDPAVFTEEMEPRDLPTSGHAKDAVDVEGYVRGFGRRRPDVDITTLRCTNLIGPRIDAALTRYFSLPVVPTVLGYDARLQMLHSEDALRVLERATLNTIPGVYNVSGEGVIMLSQALRRCGRPWLPVPGPAVSPVSSFFRGTRIVDFSADQMRFLNFGRVVDTTKLREQFGYTPRWNTQLAFDDFVHGHGLRPVVDPDHITTLENTVSDVMAKLR